MVSVSYKSVFMWVLFDIGTANGKSNNVKTIQLKQNNSSKRHAVVTEEEVEDTCKEQSINLFDHWYTTDILTA